MSLKNALFISVPAAFAGLLASVALAASIHFVGTPTCSVNGSTVECSGKLAGLGTAPTQVQVSVPFECENRGGHFPPGQASGQSAPISPRGGQITFSVSTDPASCPPPQTPSFGSTATITVLQGTSVVFTGTVPVT
jgi:hypothetical protein